MKMLLVAAALAAAWSGAPAEAQNRHVQVSDLDLSRSADVDRLDRRIAAAARRACGSASSSLFGNYAASRTCRREARHHAAPQRNAVIAAAREVALAAR